MIDECIRNEQTLALRARVHLNNAYEFNYYFREKKCFISFTKEKICVNAIK
jgi:hypothetical protein